MAGTWTKDTGGTLSTSLIGAFNFEGNSNDLVTSVSGSDTSVTYSSTSGVNNQYAVYNGSTGQTTVAEAFTTYATYSVSAWIKPTSSNDAQAIQVNGIDGNVNSNVIRVRLGTRIGIMDGVSGNMWYGDTAVSSGNWYHVVVTVNSGDAAPKIYVNGTLQTLSQDGTPSLANLAIHGALYFGISRNGSSQFTGNIDATYLWSKVLSATEISDLYNSGTGSFFVASGGGTASGATLMMMGV